MSLDLLEKNVCALRVETVDDVHLAVRFASLLQIHIQDLRRSPASSVGRNSQKPYGYTANAAFSTLESNHSHNITTNTVGPDTMGSVANNVNNSGVSKDVGSDFVDDSLGYLSGMDPSMHLGQFEDSAGLALHSPFLFNTEETWNVFGNMLG